MNKNRKRKNLALGIILLFIVGLFIPSSQSLLKQTQEKSLVNSEQINKSTENGTITCYAFGKAGGNKQDVVLSSDEATLIFERLKELESEITLDPYSEKTQDLKFSFVDLLDEKGLLQNRVSKEEYLSLLNPKWVERLQKTRDKTALPQPFANRGTCVLCSVGGEGTGILIPLFLLPRPRIAMFWLGTGLTTAANLLTSKGYVAGGAQTGFTFGFMGIGISYAIPGYTVYGFIGYALLASTTAEDVEYYPPNSAPEISDINPTDRETNVPITLSELQFRIQDVDGDLMGYTVTTDPDIGSASGNLKPFGIYSVPISGLQYNSVYKWIVEVTDGKDTTTQQFSFRTTEVPFNPFNEGWHYRKQISINHSQVGGYLRDFTVLVRTVDTDLSTKAQLDGDDILFMDGSGVAHTLYHEIESYESTSGSLVAWVKLPVLSSENNTIFYMYYGNSGCSNQQHVEETWDADFMAVWHMNDSTTSTIRDSTSLSHIFTKIAANTPFQSTGKIGYGQYFDGDNDYATTPDDNHFDFAGQFTLEAWMKPTNTDADGIILYRHGPSTGFALQQRSEDLGHWGGYIWTGSDTYSNEPPSGNWQHVVYSRNSGNVCHIYVNGVLQTDSDTSATNIDSNSLLYLGIRKDLVVNYLGYADEIRISNTERNVSWVATEFNNQNNPAYFSLIGLEEHHP